MSSRVVERIRERQKVQEAKQDEVRKEAIKAVAGITIGLLEAIIASQPRKKKWWQR